jgi:ribosome biogenesis ATPase
VRHAGFVGADLAAVTKEAAALAVNRIFKTLSTRESSEQPGDGGDGDGDVTMQSPTLWGRGEPLTPEELEPLSLTMADFEVAVGEMLLLCASVKTCA